MKILLVLAIIGLAGCKYDETISGYTDTDASWKLTLLNGAPFKARATISFPSKGKASGMAPCNHYNANQDAPLPWFEITSVASTKMACPDLKAEHQFFSVLQTMTQAEALGDTLILSNDAGDEMVFKSAP